MKVTISSIRMASGAPAPYPARQPARQPASENVHQDQRSYYDPPAYGSPSAAASAHLPMPPLHAQAQAPHGVPIDLPGYGYAAPQYRDHDDFEEPARFADMQHAGYEHEAIARGAYDGYEAPPPPPAPARLGGAVYGAPEVGDFAYRNAPGRLVNMKAYYAVTSGALYRGVEEPRSTLSGDVIYSYEPLRDSRFSRAANAQAEAQAALEAHLALLPAYSFQLMKTEEASQDAQHAAHVAYLRCIEHARETEKLSARIAHLKQAEQAGQAARRRPM